MTGGKQRNTGAGQQGETQERAEGGHKGTPWRTQWNTRKDTMEHSGT